MTGQELKGLKALVCGASEGIGKSTAERLAAMGATITITARIESKLIEVINGLSIHESQKHEWFVLDFDDTQSLKK